MTDRTATTGSDLLTVAALRKLGACEPAINQFQDEFGEKRAHAGVKFGVVLARIASSPGLSAQERISYVTWLLGEFADTSRLQVELRNQLMASKDFKGSTICREALFRAAERAIQAIPGPCKKSKRHEPTTKQFRFYTHAHANLGELRDNLEFMSLNLMAGNDYQWATCLLSYVELALFGEGEYAAEDLADVLVRGGMDKPQVNWLNRDVIRRFGRRIAPLLVVRE